MNFPDSKEVFTTGVPKSGNTWLNRLLSDLFKAPLQNNHNEPIQYYGIGEYQTDYVIRKLHMPWDAEISAYHCYDDDIRDRCVKGTLVFIHRDPRAVMTSAMHYRNSTDLMGVIKQQTREYKPQATQNAYEAWVNSYLQSDKADFIITYEGLHDDGVAILRRIYEKVAGVSPDDGWVEDVIARQSFKKIQSENTDFYWKGRKDSWREFFKYEHGKFITEKLGEFMHLHGFIDDLNWYKELPHENNSK